MNWPPKRDSKADVSSALPLSERIFRNLTPLLIFFLYMSYGNENHKVINL